MKYFYIFVLLLSAQAMAHSGGTDSSGCHHERRTGGYHCHRSDEAPTKETREPASEVQAEANTELEKSESTKEETK